GGSNRGNGLLGSMYGVIPARGIAQAAEPVVRETFPGRPAMKIRCPNCGRMGSLPDRVAADAHSLRCRRCSLNFRMSRATGPGVESRLGTDVEVPVSARAATTAPSLLREGFFAGWDEHEPAMQHLGPGDSHYELTFTLGDPSGETAVDWSGGSGGHDLADEGPSGEVGAPGGAAGRPAPGSYRFTASPGRLIFSVGLALAVCSLPLLGLLLVRSFGGSPAAGSTTLALVVGSLAAMSFLLISASMAASNLLLVDQARNVRQLRDPAERETGIVRG